MGTGRFAAVGMLAYRFLLSKSSEGFVSFIAWVSIAGVALGVLALVSVTSVINGFEGELARVITGMNGDIVLYSRGEPLENPEGIEAKIRRILPEAKEVTASFITETMASGPDGVSGAVFEGIDPITIGRVTAVPQRVVTGRLPAEENEIAVTSALADKIGAKVDTSIRLVLPFTGEEFVTGDEVKVKGRESRKARLDPEAGSPRAIEVKVVGIVRMGMYEYDSKFIFGSLKGVQDFAKNPDRVTGFKIKLADGADARRASLRLGDAFAFPFRAKDWAQLNKNLFYAIQLEKVVIAIILTVIVIVAAFNVVSTLMMMIHDKTREIAILKAMGLEPLQAFSLFCLIGMVMGTIGTGLGIAGGIGVNELLKKAKFIELPPDIYPVSYLAVMVRWNEVFLIGVVALLLAFVATWYPGWQVARRSPLEGIRYE